MVDESQSGVLLSAHLWLRYGKKPPVLSDVDVDIRRGEVLGLIGQSGSGKSTLALAILGLLDRKHTQVEGTVRFDGADLLRLSESDLRGLRGRKLALVLQSPLSSLNPALKIRTQLKEAWRAHASGPKADCEAAIRAALESVSLPATDELFLYQLTSKVTIDCLVDRLGQWWETVRLRFARITLLVLNPDHGPENHGSHRTQFMAQLVSFVAKYGISVRLVYYPALL